MASLNDDEIAELINGDVSDLDEFDEGSDINFETLDEILLQFPDVVDVMYLFKYNDII